jgi:hypothetical protein
MECLGLPSLIVIVIVIAAKCIQVLLNSSARAADIPHTMTTARRAIVSQFSGFTNSCNSSLRYNMPRRDCSSIRNANTHALSRRRDAGVRGDLMRASRYHHALCAFLCGRAQRDVFLNGKRSSSESYTAPRLLGPLCNVTTHFPPPPSGATVATIDIREKRAFSWHVALRGPTRGPESPGHSAPRHGMHDSSSIRNTTAACSFEISSITMRHNTFLSRQIQHVFAKTDINQKCHRCHINV